MTSHGSVEPLRRMNQILPKLMFKSPDKVFDAFGQRNEVLQALREAQTTPDFDYARELVIATAEERETFFSNMILLVDRQADNHARYEILCHLAELAAVEYDPHVPVGGLPFGIHALQTLCDIMPSVVGIADPLKKAVKGKLVNILDEMSTHNVLAILPTLIDMVKDPKNGAAVAKEFFDITDQLVDVFKYTVILMNGKVLNTEDQDDYDGVVVHVPGAEDADPPFDKDQQIRVPCQPLEAFANICELMAICAQSDDTSLWYHEERISFLLNVEKIHLMQGKDIRKEMAVHRLMGAMARTCEQAADTFTYPEQQEKRNSKRRPFILESLTIEIRLIEDRNRSSKLRPQKAAQQAMADALLMTCLFGIMSSSKQAARWIKNNNEINANTFINTLIKIARNSERAVLVAAAMDGLFMLATTKLADLQEKFQDSLEKECDIANKLQEIMRNLLTNKKNWVDAHRQAMISCLNMMTVYSNNAEISSQLNESDFEGYDRESIIFGLLDSGEDNVSEEVKLAAAETLRVVPLTEFDKAEIRDVVNMLSSVPALVSTKTYDTISNLVFLMFKMAMDGHDDFTSSDRQQSCGATFRTIYATEVVSAVFGNIDKALEGDMANASQAVESRKRRFETACIKFLMAGWEKQQLRQGLTAPPIVATLVKAMETEQRMISYINETMDIERFQFHEHLFLEQTYCGYNVRSLLKCIGALHERDVVAFRCVHQLSNVLQGIQQKELLVELEQVANDHNKGFDVWHYGLECGYEVHELAYLEALDWPHHVDMLAGDYPIVDASPDHAQQFAEVQVQYWRHIYRVRNKEINPAKWQHLITDSSRDQRIVHLAMIDNDPDDPRVSAAEHRVVAFCGAGPFRKKELYEDCELMGLYVNPLYDQLRETLQKKLLAAISHRMSLKGYKRCYSFVHEQERGLYDATNKCQWYSYENQDGEFVMSPISSSGEADATKPLLVGWDLSRNIWTENDAHDDFIMNSGIQTVVNFLTKPDDITLSEYDASEMEETLEMHIKQDLEAFGPSLMKELDPVQQGEEDLKARMKTLRQPADMGEFVPMLEAQFKDPHVSVVAQSVDMVPLWDNQLSGSEEENFVQALTLSLQADQLNLPVPALRLAKRVRKKLTKKKIRQERQKLYLLQFMGPQVGALCAAMYRGFYMLLVSGGHEYREKALLTLRDPVVVHSIRSVLSDIGFGVRADINDYNDDTYQVAMKFLRLVKEIIFIYPHGLNQSLVAIELFEVLKQVIEDMFVRLVTLINSRNMGTRDPLHRTRALHRYEEALMSEACLVTSELLNQVAYIQFFSGAVRVHTIYNGNTKCRQFAMNKLFGDSKIIQDSLLTFLLYDAEMSAGLRCQQGLETVNLDSDAENEDDEQEFDVEHEATEEEIIYKRAKATANTRRLHSVHLHSSGYYRDHMKIHILDILGDMCCFDEEFKRKFIQTYNNGQLLAEQTVRASFVQTVLAVAKSRDFRVKLERALAYSDSIFTTEGETIVDHAFVYHGTTDSLPKLLVLSNKFYYLSREEFDMNLPIEDMDVFTDLVQMTYSSITRLSLAYGNQIFSVEHFSGVPAAEQPMQCDVYLHRRLGVAERLLRTFSRFCTNDLAQQLPINMVDHYTRYAIEHIYRFLKKKFSSAPMLQYTHCFVLSGKEKLDRVLVWTPEESILVLSADVSKWAPSADMEECEFRSKGYLRFHDEFNLQKMTSVEFTDTPRSVVVISFRNKSLTILFKCDTAREQWRRRFKQFLGQESEWRESVLPDLHEQDRHTRKLI